MRSRLTRFRLVFWTSHFLSVCKFITGANRRIRDKHIRKTVFLSSHAAHFSIVRGCRCARVFVSLCVRAHQQSVWKIAVKINKYWKQTKSSKTKRRYALAISGSLCVTLTWNYKFEAIFLRKTQTLRHGHTHKVRTPQTWNTSLHLTRFFVRSVRLYRFCAWQRTRMRALVFFFFFLLLHLLQQQHHRKTQSQSARAPALARISPSGPSVNTELGLVQFSSVRTYIRVLRNETCNKPIQQRSWIAFYCYSPFKLLRAWDRRSLPLFHLFVCFARSFARSHIRSFSVSLGLSIPSLACLHSLFRRGGDATSAQRTNYTYFSLSSLTSFLLDFFSCISNWKQNLWTKYLFDM